LKQLTFVALVVVAALALTACGEEKDKEGLSKACPAAPAAMATAPTLPGKFPDAAGIAYTKVSKDGPSTIATGYLESGVEAAHDAYVTAVSNAAGYSVTKEEQDEADAEVNFSGNGQSGQVKMLQTCESRTTVTITIRPA
jgi:hypothetical protein